MNAPSINMSPLAAECSASTSSWHYLDNHASTLCDPRVANLMLPALTTYSAGNPSSIHFAGRRVREMREQARIQVATLIGADTENVIFTSSATEANNLAIVGTALAARKNRRGNHIITTAVEHPSVLEPIEWLKKHYGFRVSIIPVDSLCRVSTDAVLKAVTNDTILVSVMSANNEVGTMQPIKDIFNALPLHVIKHTDASQSAGRIPINLMEVSADLVTLVGHKMHGPKGIGALCKGPHAELHPQILGNHQEFGLRAGTENIPCIVGLGAACAIYHADWQIERDNVSAMRDELQANLLRELDNVKINGDASNRLPGNLNVSFLGVRSHDLMRAIPTICVSSGAACTSARGEPSHVLKAMACAPERAESSIRFGLSRFNTHGEVEEVSRLVISAVKSLRMACCSSQRGEQ